MRLESQDLGKLADRAEAAVRLHAPMRERYR
jgi:hypothetical protein